VIVAFESPLITRYGRSALRRTVAPFAAHRCLKPCVSEIDPKLERRAVTTFPRVGRNNQVATQRLRCDQRSLLAAYFIDSPAPRPQPRLFYAPGISIVLARPPLAAQMRVILQFRKERFALALIGVKTCFSESAFSASSGGGHCS